MKRQGLLKLKMVPIENVIPRLQVAIPGASQVRQKITKPVSAGILGLANCLSAASLPTEQSNWVAAAMLA
jgi:hypothetical protein